MDRIWQSFVVNMSRLGSIAAALTVAAGLCAPNAAISSEDDTEPPPVADLAIDAFAIDESNFDQWIFQGSGSSTAGKARMDAYLKLKIEELTRVCELSELQKKKLTLAARGDMKRFFDQVEVVRKKFQAVKNDRNGFNQIWQEISPLQQKQQIGLFGDSSMFAKTLQKTLTEEQLVSYRKVTEDRRRYRFRASIEVALVNLGNTVALRHDQHQALVKLIVDESALPHSFGQFDEHLVTYAMSKIPAAKLKAIVDDRQWKLLQPHLNQGRGMEAFLAQQGVIDAPKGAAAANGFMEQVGAFFGVAEIVAAQPFGVVEVQVEAVAIEEGAERPPADALNPERPHERDE
jgi:hypothetical protein